MKQIIDLSCQNSFLPSYTSMNDILKLRLRGKGSGFKEGNLLQGNRGKKKKNNNK